MLVSMDTCYNCEPMLFKRYVFMKNKVIGEKKMNFEKNCSYNRIVPSPRNIKGKVTFVFVVIGLGEQFPPVCLFDTIHE